MFEFYYPSRIHVRRIVKIISLVLTLFLIGCSEHKESVRDIDPELETYVSDFESTYNITVNYSVKLASLPGSVAGRCYGFRSSYPSVVINTDFFNANKHDYITIQYLVFHELGHCSLGLEHDPTRLGNGYPKSIMFPAFFANDMYYRNNLNYYINELNSK